MEGCESCSDHRTGERCYVRVSYFNPDWEEFDHLSFGGATPQEAAVAVGQWLEWLAVKRFRAYDPDSPFKEVVALTVEVDRGQKG